MRVSELCVKDVATAAPEETVAEAAGCLRDREVGTLVVVDSLRRPLGIVTDRDIMVRCVAEPRAAGKTRLGQVMSAPVAWVHETATVEAALDEMARLRVRRLPVVDDHDRLVGMLALDDVILERASSDAPLARALRATI